jgi:NAD(P)-dependent dehydrogenase (short-subunit alcohol dehydrogenase family)
VTTDTVVVTGASSGIGQAVAERFGRQGDDVVVNYYSNEDGASETAEAVRAAGGEALVLQANVGDPAEAAAMIERAREEFGGIDVLVNNAGVNPRADWGALTWEEWTRTIAVNVGGVFNTCREVVPAMAERGEGAVVNTSSTAAIRGGTSSPPYVASKGAITSLTRQMGHTFGPEGVRVNCVVPGPVKTRMNAEKRERDEYLDRMSESIPLARLGEPEEVASVVTFLAGPEASFVNAENVVVDGGFSA